ncbi:MAG: methyltransferase FkbM domain protein [bacterium]|nr:methyltransferase FkbM domain protein [bacterium]
MTRLVHLLNRLRAFYRWSPHQVVSYSQEGEDLILSRLFAAKTSGFFVDVGAHDPQRFSNTFLFYQRGWRGMNIDAMPGSMVPFRRARPRDINLEIPVLKERKRLAYYEFNDPALNGFSEELSAFRKGLPNYHVVRTIELEGRPLAELLTEYLPSGQTIDFLSVDVEGLDLEVLESNDWSRFRPKVVLVEVLSSSLDTLPSHPIHRLMHNHGYQVFAKALNTVFFLSNEYLQERR